MEDRLLSKPTTKPSTRFTKKFKSSWTNVNCPQGANTCPPPFGASGASDAYLQDKVTDTVLNSTILLSLTKITPTVEKT